MSCAQLSGVLFNSSSQCPEERHQVIPLLIGEDKVEVPLIVANHILELRCNPVMEVRRSGGQPSQCWRLELSKIVPQAGDVAFTRVRQLPHFSCDPIAEGIQRQVRRPRLGRGGMSVEQQVIKVRTVVRGTMTADTTAAISRIDAVE